MKTAILWSVLLTWSSALYAGSPPQQVLIAARLTNPATKVRLMPTVTTVAGAKASLRVVQDNALQDGEALPSGVILDCKTQIIGGRISYSGLLTVREEAAREQKLGHEQIAFSTTEMLFSGMSDSGQQFQLELPDKSVLVLTLTIVNPDGTPATKS